MTQDELMELAREAGIWTGGIPRVNCVASPEALAKFAALVEARKKEQCAKVCDDADKGTHPADLADAIRGLEG